MAASYLGRRAGIPADPRTWDVQCHLLDYLESAWREPDEGIWEVRGPRRHFTHSKVMAWVAVDRMIKCAEEFEAGLLACGAHQCGPPLGLGAARSAELIPVYINHPYQPFLSCGRPRLLSWGDIQEAWGDLDRWLLRFGEADPGVWLGLRQPHG
jgi:hypothetical protein